MATTEQVWQALEKELFGVLGFVTAQQEARTVGIVYVVDRRELYISSQRQTWKVRHIAHNPHVSMTIPIAKRIPIMPWIKIPAATITFSGTAEILDMASLDAALLTKLFQGRENEPDIQERTCVIKVTPEKDFITYGIAVSLMTMRHPEQARGRASVR